MTNKKKSHSYLDFNNKRYFTDNKKIGTRNKIDDDIFRQFFENEPEYCYIVSTNGEIINVNRAALKILGYKKQELIGKDLKIIYAPVSLPKMKKLFTNWKKTGHIKNEEMTIITKNGDKRIVLLSVDAIREEDGKIKYSVSTQRDITKLKQIENSLLESTERFKVMFESSHDLISLADDKGTTIWANPAWKKTLGYTPKTHGDPMDKIHPNDRPYVLKKWEEFKQDTSAFTNIEYQYKTASGNYVYLETTVRPLTVSGKNRLYVAAHNITDRKRVEKEKAKFLYDLGERVKELNCLYGLSKLFDQPNISIEEIYQGAVNLIPPSWQYPDITCARIIIENKEFITTNFKESKYKQSSDIKINGKIIGSVDVYYLEKKPEIDEGPFLKEERDLINAIAERLGRVTEHKTAEDKVINQNEFLNNVIESLAHPFYVIDTNNYQIITANSSARFGILSDKTTCHALTHLSSKPCGDQDHICPLKEVKKTKKPVVVEHVHYDKDGNPRNVEVHAHPIFNNEGNVVNMIEYCLDITERKKMEIELQKSHDRLEEQVEDRTAQLADANKKLGDEISERKKAEKKAVETMEYLQNVINSASEIVISFDINNRISTWNKTAELLTGYKQKEVINRSVNKLTVFDNLQNILDDIKSVTNNKKLGYDDLVLLTKENTKKIIRVSGSCIEDDNKKCIGSLFIGNDITRDIEIHGKLLQGNSYLIPDKSNISAVDLLIDLTTSGSNGLFISRANPEVIKSIIPSSNIKVVLFSQEKLGKFKNLSNPSELIKTIETFCVKNKEPIILLDGVHYLITRFSFNKFIESLYQINEIIIRNKSILFIRFDPSLVDPNQWAIIENELQLLPSQKVEGLIIEDDVYETLKYIHQQNQNNALVSFKKIMSKFNIAYVTAAKRLETLENKGLIFTKRQGKLRTVNISERGKTFLHKRQTA